MIYTTQPKVLIIYNSRIHDFDQHGISLRGWFKNWDKNNLAQIYSGYEINENLFCKKTYKIQSCDRRFGFIFNFLRKKDIISNQLSKIKSCKNEIEILSIKTIIVKKVTNFIIESGLWEIIFKIRISKEMQKFILNFSPDIIYCQGYSISFIELPYLISKKYNIPICFQTGDDWPKYLYSNSPISFLIRPYVVSITKKLITNSILCFANGEEMAEVFKIRYQKFFYINMMGDDIKRYPKSILKDSKKKNYEILYTGNLGSGRTESVYDIISIVEKLNKQNLKISLKIFATTFPSDFINQTYNNENIILLEAPSHNLLPIELSRADILLIPESFSKSQSESISLSISTKAHLYMYSKVPILIYAPKNTGISKYAKKYNFGLIVDERSPDELEKAILNLLFDKNLRDYYINNSIDTAHKNHNQDQLNYNFEYLLKTHSKK